MKKFVINITVNETFAALQQQLAIAQAALEEANNASTSSAANTAKTKATNALSAAQTLAAQLDSSYTSAANEILEEMQTCVSGCTTRYNKLVDDEFVATMNAINVGTAYTASSMYGPAMSNLQYTQLYENGAWVSNIYYGASYTTKNIRYKVCYNPPNSRTIWLIQDQMAEPYGHSGTPGLSGTLSALISKGFPTMTVTITIAGKTYTVTGTMPTKAEAQTAGVANMKFSTTDVNFVTYWTKTPHENYSSNKLYYTIRWNSSANKAEFGTSDTVNNAVALAFLIKINY